MHLYFFFMKIMTRFILNFILIYSLILVSPGLHSQTILVPLNSTWKYLDDGSDQDTAWRALTYDDESWSSGPAELGYGDGGESTVLSYGPNASNKYITYYFTHKFVLVDTITSDYFMLRLQRDDGAVVYLNGNEVCRSNMPAGPIAYQTLASTAVSGTDESTLYQFLIPSNTLTDTNLLAVEIHQSDVTSSDISFNLQLSTTGFFRKSPYLLFTGNNSNMTVMWQLYDTFQTYISWGTNQEYLLGNQQVSEFGPDHQYSYSITGLTPSTKYYYRVIAGIGDTITGDFRTAPAEDANEVTFFAYGDTRTYPLNHDSLAQLLVQDYTADPDAQGIAILTGDLVSDGNSELRWDEQFFDPVYSHMQELFRTIPIISARGNHEGTGLLFKKYFPFPFYTSDKYYWSFDYGPVHICVVDQYNSYAVGSEQYNWINADLAGSSKPWKFLLLHEPGWSAGGGHSNNTNVQTVLQPLCLEYGVQFVFNGHNHYYSRAEVSGVEHITTGGGGAPLRTPNLTYPYIISASSSYHFCKIHIDNDTLELNVIKDDGTIIESVIYHNYHEWTGAIDNDWNNASNWSKGTVPGGAWNVLIPQGLSNYPQVSGTASCKILTLETGTWITVLNGSVLNINKQPQEYETFQIPNGSYMIRNK
jgi:hypothetical protein